MIFLNFGFCIKNMSRAVMPSFNGFPLIFIDFHRFSMIFQCFEPWGVPWKHWKDIIFHWFSYILSLRGAMNALKIIICHWFYCISSPGGPCKLIEVTIFQLISIAFHWFPFDFLFVPIEFHWFPFFRGSRKDRVSKIGSCVTWNSQGKAANQPTETLILVDFPLILVDFNWF